MKRILKFSVLAITAAMIFTSCEFLQSGLSSTLNNQMGEETGVASIADKVWYYNGIAGDDMSSSTVKLGNDYYDQSLLISFSKKVALNSLSGSFSVSYTDDHDDLITKNISSIRGTFTDDYKGFKLDMSDVVKLLDGKNIPSGTATLNLKAGGFVCAEGPQSGRGISTLEVRGIKILPLYKSTKIDFSTVGFNTASEVKYELNGEVKLASENYTVKGIGSDSKLYGFSVSSDGSAISLKPAEGFDFTNLSALKASLDNVSIPLNLSGIIPVTSGDSFNQKITLSFSKYSIIIDGKKDANFEEENGAVVEKDASSDQSAFAENYPSYASSILQKGDIQEVSLRCDDDYLYIGLSGNLALTWNEAVVLLISNGKVTGGNGASCAVTGTGKIDFATNGIGARPKKVQPNVFVTHQPGYENNGNGKLYASAYVSSANTDIASSVKYSPKGWTEETLGSFIEYAIPLGSATGINSGDEISVIAGTALIWGEGNALTDVCPDSAAVYNNGDHTDVKYDFAHGIKFTVPAAN